MANATRSTQLRLPRLSGFWLLAAGVLTSIGCQFDVDIDVPDTSKGGSQATGGATLLPTGGTTSSTEIGGTGNVATTATSTTSGGTAGTTGSGTDVAGGTAGTTGSITSVAGGTTGTGGTGGTTGTGTDVAGGTAGTTGSATSVAGGTTGTGGTSGTIVIQPIVWALPSAATCIPNTIALTGLRRDAPHYVSTTLGLTVGQPLCSVSDNREVLTIATSAGSVRFAIKRHGAWPPAAQDCMQLAGSGAELVLGVRASHRIGTAGVFTATNGVCLQTAVYLGDGTLDPVQSLTLAQAVAPILE